MRVADYIIDYLYRQGVTTVFMGSGGGMMYLSDAVKKHEKIRPISFHHEQGAGYAAVGYAKYTNTPAVCIVTSGCGGTNAMTPLLVAYQDYVPVIFIQGQTDSKYKDNTARKFGVQGMNIKAMVESMADYYDLETGVDIATIFENCRKTNKPAWLEIPIFYQCKELS